MISALTSRSWTFAAITQLVGRRARGETATSTFLAPLLAAVVALAVPLDVARAVTPEVTADLVRVSTPLYKPELSKFHPLLGSYTYSVSWQGIPAATAALSVDQDGGNYRLGVTARTASGIDLFYKLRYRAESSISAFDYLPERTTINSQENSTVRTVDMSFLENGEVFAVRTHSRKNDTNIMRFNPENHMLDPFSAAFIARSLDWHVGDSREFDVFNGKSRYLITLNAVERRSIEWNGQSRDCFVIEPQVVNLVNEKQNSKLRKAQIFITADTNREVLRIVSDVFVGTVVTELDSFKPMHKPLIVAQQRAESPKENLVR